MKELSYLPNYVSNYITKRHNFSEEKGDNLNVLYIKLLHVYSFRSLVILIDTNLLQNYTLGI